MMRSITVKQLRDVLKKNDPQSVCIDVRTPGEYEHMKINGTVNIPFDELKDHVDELKKYKTIFLQCSSGNRSMMACNMLENMGITNIYNVIGGIAAWQEFGMPLVCATGRKPIPLMRQVMIVAGALILFSLLLTFTTAMLSPLWIVAGVGIGLLYGGLSGHCVMMRILAKMPWNGSNGTCDAA